MLQRLHQLTKTFLTDGVFHAAGVFLGGVGGNARLDQPLRKEAVLCVDFLRRFPSNLRQAACLSTSPRSSTRRRCCGTSAQKAKMSVSTVFGWKRA